MKRRSWLRMLLFLIIVLIAIVLLTDNWVTNSTKKQLYSDPTKIPHNKVGLLLGTSKYIGRSLNLYYKYRIEAAYALYRAGKIDYILVSGDNRKENYNEPETMRADLLAMGIPADKIVLDYAGFRTLDSILRCDAVFGEDTITVISQAFHNARAIFIANRKGITAIGFNANDVPKNWSWRVSLREKLARVKMLLDLMTNKGPKYYGDRIKIG